MLCPTPQAKLCDAEGRPYFLWDCNVTLAQLRDHLSSPHDDQRVYWLSKVMRQAKPDDALVIGDITEMRRLWPRLEGTLGNQRAFWAWYLDWTNGR